MKTYSQLKYMGNVFRVGNCAMVQEDEFNVENFAAVIRSIVSLEDLVGCSIPLVEVQWYGSREDVLLPDKYIPCISDNELFLST